MRESQDVSAVLMGSGCDCVAKFNERLKEHNCALVTTLFGTPKPVIETYKLDSKRRGKAPAVLASFCPFCGVSLLRQAATKGAASHGA